VSAPADTSLEEHTPGRVWLAKYPIHYAGCDFFARTTFVRLNDGRVLVHSPGPCTEPIAAAARDIGQVRYLVAPGSYHYFYVHEWQAAFTDAETFICPGVERKCPGLEFDAFLSDHAPEAWANEIDQVLVRGNRFIWEVAFFDRPSKTLVLTDLLENIGERSEGTNWVLRFWWKVVLDMWDKPKPAPEYQMGWRDKAAARRSLERILQWDFERIILAHGENIDSDAKAVLREAWAKPLAFQPKG
jgi:hypothetical protein